MNPLGALPRDTPRAAEFVVQERGSIAVISLRPGVTSAAYIGDASVLGTDVLEGVVGVTYYRNAYSSCSEAEAFADTLALSLAYSALASRSVGTSASASLQAVKKLS